MKSQKPRLLWYVAPLLFICLVLLSLHLYVVQYHKNARNEAYYALERTAGIQANALGAKLDGLYYVLGNNARDLSSFRWESGGQEDVCKVLANIESAGDLIRAGFANPDGDTIWADGSQTNIQDQSYFQESLHGAYVLFPHNLTGNESGEAFLLSVPVMASTGEPGGVLFASVPAQSLQTLLASTIYESSGYTILADKSGKILLDSAQDGSPQTGGPSLTALLSSASYARHYSAELALAALSAENTYTFPAVLNGTSFHITLQPIGYNGWLLLTAIPREVIDAQMLAATRMVYLLAFTIIALSALLCLFFAMANRKRNRLLTEERDRLYKSEELYRCLQDFSPSTLFEVDVATGNITYNQAFLDYLGRAPVIQSMFQYLEPNPIIFEEDMTEWIRFGKDMNDGVPASAAELRTISADGVLIWHRAEYRYLYDAKGAPYRIVGRYTVINEEKSRLEKLQQLTETDSLTGLFNHPSMRSRVNDALAHDGLHKIHALLVIDIDDFKLVNDTLGHIEGDAVLVRIAQSIRDVFRATDLVARLGGDEFAVFIRNASSPEAVVQKALTLLNALQFIHMRDGRAVNVSASIGVALANRSANVFEILYERADTALYHAKSDGKNRYALFNDTYTMADIHYVNTTRQEQDQDGLIPSGNASIQLRALLSHMLGGVLLLEIGPAISPLYISPGYLKMMGLEDNSAKDLTDPIGAIYKDDRQKLVALLHDCAASGEAMEHTYRVAVNGSTLWHNFRAIRIPYEESNYPVLIMLITDVTEAHDTAARLESIVKNAPLGIALLELGPDANRMIFANQELRRFIDYNEDEFDGAVMPNANTMVDPKYLPGLLAEIQSAIRERRTAKYVVRTSPDLPSRCRWSMFRGVLLEDGGDKPLFLIMISDLTALKTMELQAQASAERYRLAFDQTTATFWEYDFGTGQSIQSSATVKEYGLTSSVYDNLPDDFINSGLIHRDSAGTFRAFFAQLKGGTPSGNCAVKVRRANGLYDWARVSYKTEFDPSGAPHKAIGIVEGISGMVGAKLRFEHEEWIFETLAVEMIACLKLNLTRRRVDLLFLPGRQALRGEDITPEETLSMGAARIEGDHIRERFVEAMTIETLKEHFGSGEETFTMQYQRRQDDGSLAWAAATARVAIEPASGDYYCFGYVQDISARKGWEAAADGSIAFDEDTLLYDNATTRALVEQSLAANPGAQNVLLLIDISDFSGVERQYGIMRTKKLLRSIGNLLNLCVPTSNITGYLGDGRFAIFMPCIFSEASALNTVDRSLGAIQSRGVFAIGSGEITYASGIVLADEPEQTFQGLYDSAILTMAEVDAQNLSRYILFSKQM